MSEKNNKKIWTAKFKHGLLSPSNVLASDENEALREAYSLYRYHSAMSFPDLAVRDIVDSVSPAENQRVYGGVLTRAVSEFVPEKPSVNFGQTQEQEEP